MTLGELRKQIKDLPDDLVIGWDSHGHETYFGDMFDVESFHKDDVLEEDGDLDHIPEGKFTAMVFR